jgi:hypothetical protein
MLMVDADGWTWANSSIRVIAGDLVRPGASPGIAPVVSTGGWV